MTTKKIKILVVDDEPKIRMFIRANLEARGYEVHMAQDGVEAVETASRVLPDVIILDVNMPNMDGIEATRRIKDKDPSISVIVLTMYDNDAYVIDAVRAGASGYLLKEASRELLLHTIRTVSSGATLIKTDLLYEAICSLVASRDRHQKPGVSVSEGLETLTAREQEVLKLVVDGHTNKEIGKELGITEDTVKKHMQSILAKLDATSWIGAVAKATRAGIVK